MKTNMYQTVTERINQSSGFQPSINLKHIYQNDFKI